MNGGIPILGMGTEQDFGEALLRGAARCTATRKDGSPCSRHASRGTATCYHHGGAAARQVAAAMPVNTVVEDDYKRIPGQLQTRYRKYRDDPKILNSNTIIARLEIMWDQYIAQHGTRNDSQNVKDKAIIIEQLDKAKEREHKKRYGEKYAVNVNEVAIIIGMVSSVINRHVSDVPTRRLIQQALIKLPLADVEVLTDASSPD